MVTVSSIVPGPVGSGTVPACAWQAAVTSGTALLLCHMLAGSVLPLLVLVPVCVPTVPVGLLCLLSSSTVCLCAYCASC